MPSVISAALLRFLPWIAGALLALGILVYMLHEHAALRRSERNVAAARDTVTQLEATNQANLDALKQLQRTAAAWQVAQGEVAAEDAHRAATARQMLDAISASTPSGARSATAPAAPAGGTPTVQASAAVPPATRDGAAGIPAILARTLDSIAAAQAAGSDGRAAPAPGQKQGAAPNGNHPHAGAKQ